MKESNLTEREKAIERTGKKLIVFWFIIGFILGALIL